MSRFVYAGRVNLPAYMVKGGVSYRLIADHVGSPRLVVNAATGAVVQRLDYDAFGNVTQDTNPGFQPFGFAGGLYDRDTGLVRFGARDYDPRAGRWTAKDPLLFAGGDFNLYVYAGNDPVNGVDPNGLQDRSADGSDGGAAAPQKSGWWDKAREWWGRKADLLSECKNLPGGQGAKACLQLICETAQTKFGAGEAGSAAADNAGSLANDYKDRYNDNYRRNRDLESHQPGAPSYSGIRGAATSDRKPVLRAGLNSGVAGTV